MTMIGILINNTHPANTGKFTRIGSMPGWDKVPMLVFKSMDKAALEILSQAFNSIIVEGLPIPSSWKEGLLLPLPKISQPKSLSDFRPIVVLPIIYRLLNIYNNVPFISYCKNLVMQKL